MVAAGEHPRFWRRPRSCDNFRRECWQWQRRRSPRVTLEPVSLHCCCETRCFFCVSRVQPSVKSALQVMESGPFVNWISRNISTASEIFDLCAAAARSPTPMLSHACLSRFHFARALSAISLASQLLCRCRRSELPAQRRCFNHSDMRPRQHHWWPLSHPHSAPHTLVSLKRCMQDCRSAP